MLDIVNFFRMKQELSMNLPIEGVPRVRPAFVSLNTKCCRKLRQGPGEIDPRRWVKGGEAAGCGFRHAKPCEAMRCWRGKGTISPPRTVLDRDRHQVHDGPPTLPAMQAREVVGSHEPDEPDLRQTQTKKQESIDRVGRAKARLQRCALYFCVLGSLARCRDAVRQRAQS